VRSAVQDSGRAIGGSLVSNACNVLVILVIARWLGGEGVGNYTIAFAIRALLLLGCGLGMRTTLTRFVASHLAHDDHDHVRGVVLVGVLAPLTVSLVVAGAWFSWADPMASDIFRAPELERPLKFFALSLPFFVLTDNALAATQGFRTMGAYVWVGQVLEPVSRLGLTVVVLLGGAGLDVASMVVLASSILSAAAALLALQRMVAGLPGRSIRHQWSELALFGATSWVASVATQGLLWADVVILGALVSSQEVGAYQVAARVVLIGMLVITPLTASMAPWIAHHWARGDRDLVTARFVGVVLWISRLSLPLLAGLVAIPGAVLQLFGPGFKGATGVVLILLVGAVAETVGAPSSVVLNQIGRNRLNMIISLAALAANIILNLLLVPQWGAGWGIEGAAVAWAATLTAGAVVRVLLVRRVAVSRWPWGAELAYTGVGAALAAVAGAWVAGMLPASPGWRLPMVALIVIVICLAVMLTRGLTISERNSLARAIALRYPAVRRWRVRFSQRKAARSSDDILIDELISPFRMDVLARAELFVLARSQADLRRNNFDLFVARARTGLYGAWFDAVLVGQGHLRHSSPDELERTFRLIVLASLQVMDRHDRLGRSSLGPVSITRVPAGEPVGGWTLAEDRWVLLDGGHRIALAILDGERLLGPSEYVVDALERPRCNTAVLLAACKVSAESAVSFLARGLVAEADRGYVSRWADLLDRLMLPANRDEMLTWPEAALLIDCDRDVPLVGPD
jgi:O-antigen/teichoic acid export membrane protein